MAPTLHLKVFQQLLLQESSIIFKGRQKEELNNESFKNRRLLLTDIKAHQRRALRNLLVVGATLGSDLLS